ncbi:MAG: ATP-binding protein [Acidimicrobiales bacterium]
MATPANVTVLFTDMVGSTALSSSMSVEIGDELRRAHFSLLRQAIVAHGGTEVKNLGDGVMAVFETASGAFAGAVAMQQGVELDNRLAPNPIGLRVGIGSGDATREGDDYFGDPVVTAARLCARAEGGQILVTDVSRAIAGRRSKHRFEPLGALELKGLGDPVEALELQWDPIEMDAPGAAGIGPLPARLESRPFVGVIGRTEQLGLLNDAAKRVASGMGHEVVLIAGEPGQGKSTLVAEAARKAHENEMSVLFARCDEDVGAPYRPIAEALGAYVNHAPEGVLRSHVAAHGGELSRLVPALKQRLGELPPTQTSDPDTERYLLYGAVAGLLEEASRVHPVLLVLDDLHWADRPSLQLLRHVVANTGSSRLLVLGTYRGSELSGVSALAETLAALHREVGVSRLDLKGLDDSDVVTFLEVAAGHVLDKTGVELAHAVYRETDGNPFFVTEVLRHLSESGAIVQDAAGHWVPGQGFSQLTLPDSVREVVGARVARLGDRAAKILSIAAIIGRDFDIDLLAEVTGSDEDALLDLLDDAEASDLVCELPGTPGRYGFSHALIQHTLYEDMGATRRARMHRLVAEALEELLGDRPDERVGELARHFLLATRPVHTDKAITYAARAGEHALEALAPEDGVRYFSQALELADSGALADPLLRVRLLLSLGTAQRQAGIPAFRETLLEAARQAEELGAVDELVRAALANNRGSYSAFGKVDTEKVGVLEAALDRLPATESPDRALLLATLCLELTHGPLDRRRSLTAEAKAMAETLGDPTTMIDVLNLCNEPRQIPALFDERFADNTQALALAEQLGDPMRLFWSASRAEIDAVQGGRFEVANKCLDLMKRTSQQLHQPTLVWNTTRREAAHALVIGDPDSAEQLATEALEIGTKSGQPDAFTFYGTQLMIARFQQGRLGELVPLLADVVEENPGIPAYRAGLASAHLEAGDDDAARQLLEAASRDGFTLPPDSTWFDGLIGYCWVAVELGHEPAAGQLLELLATYKNQTPFSGVVPHTPVACYLGGLASLFGRFEEAETYFEIATNLNTAGNMRFAEAKTALLWGRMLATRGAPGDLDRARELLEKSESLSSSYRYRRIQRLVEAAGALL